MKISSTTRIDAVMTPSPHSIGAEQQLSKARKMMQELNVRHLPVRAGGQLVGILSDRDIEFALRVDAASAERLTVHDACTADVYVVEPGSFVADIASRMARERIGCAVVEHQGKLLGIFTTTDACRVLASALQ